MSDLSDLLARLRHHRVARPDFYDDRSQAEAYAKSGNLSAAGSIADDLELAMHPALAEGAGGLGQTLLRQKFKVFGNAGDNAANATVGDQLQWNSLNTVNDAPVSLISDDNPDDTIQFDEESTWALMIFWTFHSTSDPITTVNVHAQHLAGAIGDIDFNEDALFEVVSTQTFETWWPTFVWHFRAEDWLRSTSVFYPGSDGNIEAKLYGQRLA